jgi:hypothetical protein
MRKADVIALKNLAETIEKHGCPFADRGEAEMGKITHLLSGLICPEDAVEDLRNWLKKGEELFMAFWAERVGPLAIMSVWHKRPLRKSPTMASSNSNKRRSKGVVQQTLEMFLKFIACFERLTPEERERENLTLQMLAGYELSIAPMAMFDETLSMRSGNKAQLLPLLYDSGMAPSFKYDIGKRSIVWQNSGLEAPFPSNAAGAIYIVDFCAVLQSTPSNKCTTYGQFLALCCSLSVQRASTSGCTKVALVRDAADH